MIINPNRKHGIYIPSGLLAIHVLIVFALDEHRWRWKSIVCTGFALLLPVLAIVLVSVNRCWRFICELRFRKCRVLDFVAGLWAVLVCLEADHAGPSKNSVFGIANAYIVWAFFMEVFLQVQNEVGLMLTTSAVAVQMGAKLGHSRWLIPSGIYLFLYILICVFKLKPDERDITKYFREIVDTLHIKDETMVKEHYKKMKFQQRSVDHLKGQYSYLLVKIDEAKNCAQEAYKVSLEIVNIVHKKKWEIRRTSMKIEGLRMRHMLLKRKLMKLKYAKKKAMAEAYSDRMSLKKEIQTLETLINDPSLLNRAILVLANKHSGAISMTEVSELLGATDFTKKEWDLCGLNLTRFL